MNRIIVVCLTAVVLVACNHREEVSENKEAKAMLQGIWIDAEGGDVSFRVLGDTIYYADSTSMPAYFRVMGDSLVLASGASYGIVKQLPHLFWFKNQNGDVLKFSKSDDPADESEFVRDTPPVLSYSHQRSYNDDGLEVENVYYDNIMHVSVFQGSRQLFSRDFRKQQYAGKVPAEFLEEAVLGNMEFSHADAAGLHFVATLCIPDGASCYLVESLVSYQGQMTMQLVEY